MKSKLIKIYILGAILLVAIGFLLLPNKTEKNGHKVSLDKVFNFEIAEIDKIQLSYLDQTKADGSSRTMADLAKVENQWLVASNHNYKALQPDVASLLEKAKEIALGEIVSENRERQKVLEIDEEKGTSVKLYKGENIVANFWLGKAGADGNSNYFRLDGTDKVYTTKSYIGFYFNRPEWIDKNILTLEKEKINKIEINNAGQKIVLEKELAKEAPKEGEAKPANLWSVTLPWKFEASLEKIDSLIGSLVNLSATEIVFDKSKEDTGLEKTKSSITVYLVDKDPVVIMFGNKTAEASYVKLANNEQIFTVNAYLLETILLKVGDLKK
jgi:hypothetical protein